MKRRLGYADDHPIGTMSVRSQPSLWIDKTNPSSRPSRPASPDTALTIWPARTPFCCDPDDGNNIILKDLIWQLANIDIILHDHGLHGDIPLSRRRRCPQMRPAIIDDPVCDVYCFSSVANGMGSRAS